MLLLSEDQQGVLAATSCLTRLSLADSEIISEDPFAALTELSALQDLSLVHLEFEHELAQVPFSVLATLTQLTRLHLENVFGLDTLQHISCLTNLQELQLCDVYRRPYFPDPGLQGLRQLQQLTALLLQDAHLQLRTHPEVGSEVLSSLQVFCMIRVDGLDPALLHSMRQLRVLYLHRTPLLGDGTRRERTAALLAALPRLQQLQDLFLDDHQLSGLIPHLAQYSALTTSSKLQRLGCMMPTKCWHQMPGAISSGQTCSCLR